MKRLKPIFVILFVILFIILSLAIFSTKCYSQDFIRLGMAHDFQKNKVVQTFSFDFNRTENIKEKSGRFLLFDQHNFYILPTSDVNIGDGVTSCENNLLFQANIGKAFYGDLKKSKNKLTSNQWNKAIELNPSYNSDKLFSEKLAFGQAKFLLNFVSSWHNRATEPIFIKKVHSLSTGFFSNIGYRYSKTYNASNLYSTIGWLLDYKTRILNSKNDEKWIFKLSGNYYYIASDVKELTTDYFGGIIKTSLNRLALNNIYVGLSHQYGNDNPNYNYLHTLEFSLKIKY